MDLQISDCLVFNGEYLFSILKHITLNLVAQNNMCHLPVSAGQDLAVTELDVRCRMGLPSHLLTQLGEDRSAFCQVCGRGQTSVPHGLKDGRPPLLPVGVHREPQHGSFLHQKGTVRRARGRERERERGRERKRENEEERGGWGEG